MHHRTHVADPVLVSAQLLLRSGARSTAQGARVDCLNPAHTALTDTEDEPITAQTKQSPGWRLESSFTAFRATELGMAIEFHIKSQTCLHPAATQFEAEDGMSSSESPFCLFETKMNAIVHSTCFMSNEKIRRESACLNYCKREIGHLGTAEEMIQRREDKSKAGLPEYSVKASRSVEKSERQDYTVAVWRGRLVSGEGVRPVEVHKRDAKNFMLRLWVASGPAAAVCVATNREQAGETHHDKQITMLQHHSNWPGAYRESLLFSRLVFWDVRAEEGPPSLHSIALIFKQPKWRIISTQRAQYKQKKCRVYLSICLAIYLYIYPLSYFNAPLLKTTLPNIQIHKTGNPINSFSYFVQLKYVPLSTPSIHFQFVSISMYLEELTFILATSNPAENRSILSKTFNHMKLSTKDIEFNRC
ncbi:unnamed protein product [Menidia menidia]|uniref:(Atlantic silverside) hypothetical protein n=1 Tax=Menidia menidia TaxID=238744 RepID=A0A8S4APB5_9TELE|nr:unnamed protein product [Menidia menidia]